MTGQRGHRPRLDTVPGTGPLLAARRFFTQAEVSADGRSCMSLTQRSGTASTGTAGPRRAGTTMPDPDLPPIIQGGMGVGVSGWRLARAVAQTGQLGVVSGVALDAVLARRLQPGDPGGHLRRALSHFPEQGVAATILQRYYVPGGISPGSPFRPMPRLGLRPSHWRDELIAAGNFVTVWLARQGHGGPVRVNYSTGLPFWLAGGYATPVSRSRSPSYPERSPRRRRT